MSSTSTSSCVNLYPFERTAARRGVLDAEVIENIDIGGPTMIRAAAKNHAFAAPVVGPESYDAVLDELRQTDLHLSPGTREWLAAEAFAYTARYDTAIARWFQEKREDFPSLFVRAFEKVLELPYGENPHQRAAYYEQVGARTHVLSMVSQLGGKEISFNNLLDLDSGRLLLAEFKIPACVIIKHNTPCGVACGATAQEAYEKAFACDPMSAFGGIICLNRPVDAKLAAKLNEQFVEVVFARGYDEGALEILAEKPNTRILDDRERRIPNMIEPQVRQVVGGLLVQDRDFDLEDRADMQVVSERRPSEAEWQELAFAWRVCKHVKSNAIVISKDLATVGIGAGQMSRVDALADGGREGRRPCRRHGDGLRRLLPLPRRGPRSGLNAGVTAIIHPGGSVRDHLTVEAVDKVGAAMVFTFAPSLPPLRAVTAAQAAAPISPEPAVSARSAATVPAGCPVSACQIWSWNASETWIARQPPTRDHSALRRARLRGGRETMPASALAITQNVKIVAVSTISAQTIRTGSVHCSPSA